MPVESPVSERITAVCLLLLTFSTGIVDGKSIVPHLASRPLRRERVLRRLVSKP